MRAGISGSPDESIAVIAAKRRSMPTRARLFHEEPDDPDEAERCGLAEIDFTFDETPRTTEKRFAS